MAKRSSNDTKILDLKQKIEEKKAALKGVAKFTPKTNCSLSMTGSRFNLHAASTEALMLLLVQANVYRMSEADLGLHGQTVVEGYKIQDWIDDIKAMLLKANRQQEETALKNFEAQLHALLSAETKTELILSDIEKVLK